MGTHYRGTAKERLALDTCIKLMRAADSLGSALGRPLADAGLTHGQLGVLEALLHLGTLSQAEIALKLLRSGSNIVTILDNLEERGLVARTRRTADRRVIDVALTSAGREVIQGLFPAHARRITELLGVLSAADQRRLGDLCRTLGRSIKAPAGAQARTAGDSTRTVADLETRRRAAAPVIQKHSKGDSSHEQRSHDSHHGRDGQTGGRGGARPARHELPAARHDAQTAERARRRAGATGRRDRDG